MSQRVLGFSGLCHFNEALLGKRLWRFMNEKGNLWRKVVTIKYCNGGFSSPILPSSSYWHNLWKHIPKRLGVIVSLFLFLGWWWFYHFIMA